MWARGPPAEPALPLPPSDPTYNTRAAQPHQPPSLQCQPGHGHAGLSFLLAVGNTRKPSEPSSLEVKEATLSKQNCFLCGDNTDCKGHLYLPSIHCLSHHRLHMSTRRYGTKHAGQFHAAVHMLRDLTPYRVLFGVWGSRFLLLFWGFVLFCEQFPSQTPNVLK